jgi:tetratricopeptide (TPR) repeat protein
MAELQQAISLLAQSPIKVGSLPEEAEETQPISAASPISPISPTWNISTDLLRDPALHDSATAAINAGRLAASEPSDFDAVLRFGLQLQSLASAIPPSRPDDQLALLHRTCEVYGKANDLRHAQSVLVLFNWSIALTDIARLVRKTSVDEAAEYLSSAALKYKAAVEVDPGNARALNNLGLVLQDLSQLMGKGHTNRERSALLVAAASRFRAALRLQPETPLLSRVCYNLATVLHAQAGAMADNVFRGDASSPTALATGEQSRNTEDRRVRAAFARAAQYIMIAYALQPSVKIYEDSLGAMQRLLPLPFLQTGPLVVAQPSTAGTAREAWARSWFSLDARAFQAGRPPPAEKTASGDVSLAVPHIVVEIVDIENAIVCSPDPSLPNGWAIWLALRGRSQGLYVVAETKAEAECWVDMLRLVHAMSEDTRQRLEETLLSRRTRREGLVSGSSTTTSQNAR